MDDKPQDTRSDDPGDDAKPGDEPNSNLLERTGSGVPPTPAESESILDYFLANGELPGDDRLVDISFEVNAGPGGVPIEETWTFRRLAFDEWKDCIKQSTDNKGERDPYVTAAWIVARALEQPKLGNRVRQLQDRIKEENASIRPGNKRKVAPKNTAEYLRQMFAQQSGVLFEVSDKVLEYSRLSEDSGTTRLLDEEVEAGKL